MKKYIILPCVLILTLISFNTRAQKILSYRYWFDNNIAAATSVNVTGAPVVTINKNVSTSLLSAGFHTVSIQALDSAGHYSVPLTSWFVNSDTNIVTYQYWFDNNIALATTVSITPVRVADLDVNVQTTALRPGFHSITVRAMNTAGIFSAPLTTNFVKAGANLIEYEYWFDGNDSAKTDVSISATQEYDITHIDASTLILGQHVVTIHVEDQLGNWSVPITDTFQVNSIPTGVQQLSSIVNVSVFPNPTTGQSNVIVNTSSSASLNIRLINAEGKMIETTNKNESCGDYTFTLDMRHLAAGNYYCIVDDGNKSFVKSIVKQ